MTATSGWRYSTAAYMASRGVKVTDLDLTRGSRTFRQFGPPHCDPEPGWTPKLEDHGPIPDPRCTCGYNFVPDLNHLVEGMADHIEQMRRRRPLEREVQPGLWGFWLILHVESHGRTVKGWDPRDPTGTMRGDRLRVTGPVILNRRAHAGAAECLTHVGLTVRTVEDFNDLLDHQPQGAR